ncbi:uncharacterized protein RSE6_13832 [Rhynchosporium secalis]|uniref:Secreted protein n=1 Tax=Rhynchosporium secalis TaxID=38038 RepID=A0A1E1MTV3_RHYSE|nr:uncharacterized protein RSE6_13832 [Rhynchosporium secalis]
MKHLSIILACLAATHAYHVVICTFDGGASIGDVSWAIQNRKDELGLGGKGFWNGRVSTCDGEQVVSLCRSDAFSRIRTTKLEGNKEVACYPSGAVGFPVCKNVDCSKHN